MNNNLDKKYYLETNALYTLINKLDLINDCDNVYTSLFSIDEIVSGIKNDTFHRRKVLLSKLKQSKLKYIELIPMERIAFSFGVNISGTEFIKKRKKLICAQFRHAIASNNYYEYEELLKEEGFYKDAILNKESDNKRKMISILNDNITENNISIKKTKERQKETSKYHHLNIEDILLDNQKPDYSKEKEMLCLVLNTCNVTFTHDEIEDLVNKYNGRSLVAFHLGITSYFFDRSNNMKPAGKNDIYDLRHLLYLEDENYVIVSNDRIYEKATMSQMRIKCEKFISEVS